MLLPKLWHSCSRSTPLVRLTSCRYWLYNSTALDARSTSIIIHPRFALRRRSIRLLEKWPSHLNVRPVMVGGARYERWPVEMILLGPNMPPFFGGHKYQDQSINLALEIAGAPRGRAALLSSSTW